MGCGEENLFSKRFLPHKTVLQHPLFHGLLWSFFHTGKISFFQRSPERFSWLLCILRCNRPSLQIQQKGILHSWMPWWVWKWYPDPHRRHRWWLRGYICCGEFWCSLLYPAEGTARPEYTVIELSDAVRPLVIDNAAVDAANERISERYNIQVPARLK